MITSAKKCKICKRVKEKVFLKGSKCLTAKCPLTRIAGAKAGFSRKKSRSRSAGSEYGTQLREKQKVKFGYGLRERQFKNYAAEAGKAKAAGTDVMGRFFELLESRLDNVVFRLGFAVSRTLSRQIVGHGHIWVNGRRVDISSYRVKLGDKISIRPQSATKGIFKDLDTDIKNYNPPAWLKLDKDKKIGEVVGKPSLAEEGSLSPSLVAVMEFYSR